VIVERPARWRNGKTSERIGQRPEALLRKAIEDVT
jgi:hypothetical protein